MHFLGKLKPYCKETFFCYLHHFTIHYDSYRLFLYIRQTVNRLTCVSNVFVVCFFDKCILMSDPLQVLFRYCAINRKEWLHLDVHLQSKRRMIHRIFATKSTCTTYVVNCIWFRISIHVKNITKTIVCSV